MKENKYALMDDPVMDEPHAPHVKGSTRKGKGVEFWMSQPRPQGVELDDWEEWQENKWERIFRKDKR